MLIVGARPSKLRDELRQYELQEGDRSSDMKWRNCQCEW